MVINDGIGREILSPGLSAIEKTNYVFGTAPYRCSILMQLKSFQASTRVAEFTLKTYTFRETTFHLIFAKLFKYIEKESDTSNSNDYVRLFLAKPSR